MDNQEARRYDRHEKEGEFEGKLFLPTLDNLSSFVKFIWQGSLSIISAFLLGCAEMMFSTYPLGLALLCGSEKRVIFSYVGLMASAVAVSDGHTLPLMAMYTLCLGGRLIISGWLSSTDEEFGLFKEPTVLRAMYCAFVAFAYGMYYIIKDGFLYYNLLSLMFLIGVSTIACLLLCCLETERPVHKAFTVLSKISLCAFVVYASMEYEIFGFSLGIILCTLFIFLFIKEEPIYSIAAGVACGFGAGLDMLPMFAIMGLVGGLLKKVSEATSVTAALLSGIVYSLYFGGLGTFIGSVSELVFGAIIYIPISKIQSLDEADKPVTEVKKEAAVEQVQVEDMVTTKTEAEFEKQMRYYATEQISNLSDALFDMSRSMKSLSEKLKKPKEGDVRVICDNLWENHCKRCVDSLKCNGREDDDVSENMKKLIKKAFKDGVIERKDVPADILVHCKKVDGIISDINKDCATITERLICDNRTEIYSRNYEAISRLIEETIKQSEAECRINPEYTKKLVSAAKEMNLKCDSIALYGKRRKKLFASGIEISKLESCATDLAFILGNLCDTTFGEPKFTLEGDKSTLTMESCRVYKAEFAGATFKKEGEEMSGDTICAFENKDDYFYAVLSDGMGSGADAATASKICCMYSEKLLTSCGGQACKDIVFTMLNEFLKNKSPECTATADLLEIDLLNGKVNFKKSGAAPSFIVRGGKIFKISARTMPLGAIDDVDSEEVALQLQDGDMIVMVSDGVIQDFENCVWIAKLLTSDFDGTMRDLARKIVDTAKEVNTRPDDMTVGIIKVSLLKK